MSDVDEPKPLLSIVVPAHNEESRLPSTLEQVSDWQRRQPFSTEVLVVENGSTDRTAAVVRQFQRSHPTVRLIEKVPRGKGIAVRTGMLAARGGWRFLCDADLSMPIHELDRFLQLAGLAPDGPLATEPAVSSLPTRPSGVPDVLIASREAPGARRVGEPWHRHVMGRVYNLIVQILALPGLNDTQCGFKLFSAQAAEDLFRRARLGGWGFDPEVLFLARRLGYQVVEVPIEWHFSADSRVRPVSDTLEMVRDLARIRWNAWRGVYDQAAGAPPPGTATTVG